MTAPGPTADAARNLERAAVVEWLRTVADSGLPVSIADAADGIEAGQHVKMATRIADVQRERGRHAWSGPGATGRMECAVCYSRVPYEEYRDLLTEACPGARRP